MSGVHVFKFIADAHCYRNKTALAKTSSIRHKAKLFNKYSKTES